MTDKVTPRQQKALESLLAGSSKTAAAAAAGVNPKQLYLWLKQPAFSESLASAQADLLAQVNAKLLAAAAGAIDTLTEAQANPDAHVGAKIRAADVILGKLMAIRELSEIEARLSKLEGEHNETTN